MVRDAYTTIPCCTFIGSSFSIIGRWFVHRPARSNRRELRNAVGSWRIFTEHSSSCTVAYRSSWLHYRTRVYWQRLDWSRAGQVGGLYRCVRTKYAQNT